MAVTSYDGSYNYSLSPSSCKANDFQNFLTRLPYPKGTVIVLDNASVHRTKAVLSTATDKGYHLLFIPPYTPEANPIENVFGLIKRSYYKLRFCDSFTSVPSAIHYSISSLSSKSVANTFSHVQTVMHYLFTVQIRRRIQN